MKTDNIDEILCCQLCKITLIVDDTVIDRNCTDHGRTFACQLLTEWLCISMTGQIHDRLCAHINCAHYFFHLNVIVLAVSGYSKVYVDFGTQHTADTFRIQTGVFLISTDGNLSLCN